MSGANNALGLVERLSARLPQIMRQAMERALRDGLSLARQRMQSGQGPRPRSGRLMNSIRAGVETRGSSLVGWIASDAPYAAAQERGAVIQAKRARYLKFQVQGRWVQVRRVVLPARPFLRPARDEAAARLEAYLFEALEKELS